jgi:molecular chaperone DnaJ
MRGLGLPDVHGHSAGDLLVRVQVEVPKKLTDREEALVKQMAELRGEEKGPAQSKGIFTKIKQWFDDA